MNSPYSIIWATGQYGIIRAMRVIGDSIFARDAEGRLLSRIGTLFFRTPGLVTKKGVHAMQRLMWIEAINTDRAAEGKPELTITH